jgi:molybdate transport system substrate-binding protein
MAILGLRWVRTGVAATVLGAAVGARPLVAQQTLTVFAAASLAEAFTAIGKNFEAEHPDVTVRFNFAGSQTLATQIEQGAKADVFASADQRWMQYATEKGLVAGIPVMFARNRLVVVLPKSNPGYVDRLQDLARPGLKLVLAGAQVPVGAYSREALRRLSARSGFPRDFDQRVLRNLVSEEENVRAVVAKVQLREADAGIAYVTDVTPAARAQLRVLEIPDPENPIAEYPIAATAVGNTDLGRAFVVHVLSPAGQRELAARGFLPPLADH